MSINLYENAELLYMNILQPGVTAMKIIILDKATGTFYVSIKLIPDTMNYEHTRAFVSLTKVHPTNQIATIYQDLQGNTAVLEARAIEFHSQGFMVIKPEKKEEQDFFFYDSDI